MASLLRLFFRNTPFRFHGRGPGSLSGKERPLLRPSGRNGAPARQRRLDLTTGLARAVAGRYDRKSPGTDACRPRPPPADPARRPPCHDGRPAQTRRTFTTAASGTASSGGSTSTSSGGSSSTGKAKGTPSVDIAGSAVVPFRGALDAIVYKSGRLSLARNGKAVRFLKTGRYTFSVDDESRAYGFSVQVLKGKVQTVTTRAYVGNHDVTSSTSTLRPLTGGRGA